MSEHLFSSVDINDFVLVDIFEYVRSIHENSYSSHGGHDEKDVQLKSVNNHGNEFPVLTNLGKKIKTSCQTLFFPHLSTPS